MGLLFTKSKSLLAVAAVMAMPLAGTAQEGISNPSMADGLNGYTVSPPLFTVGETINGYTPPGVLDGLGAYRLDRDTVRLLANHELLNTRGYPFEIADGQGGTFSMPGSRVSYFDIDRSTRQVVDAGLAISRIFDANGQQASDNSFLTEGFVGFSRFCSSQLVRASEFGLFRARRGIVDTVYFTGEEDGSAFNPVGGGEWALDVRNGDFWQVPAFGRGAWENVCQLDTGDNHRVAFLLADDSSPFDADGDGTNEAAPLYLYVGTKQPGGNFLEKNGLSDGQLYVFVADNPSVRTPLDFRGLGAIVNGSWVEIDNQPNGTPSNDGSTGFDEYGYPTQSTLWTRAEALGAFGFSRPEDVANFPFWGNYAVLASTGVDTYAVDPVSGDGADTFGTLYAVYTDFRKGQGLPCQLRIIYDGDDDPSRGLRSPDNLDWADDGFIYVQEDKAEADTLSGEPLFGPGAANSNEAGIVVLDPIFGRVDRIANINRDVVLDASIADPTNAVDVDAGSAGEWESSGILDVSRLFGEPVGTLFIFNVQAHGIEDQDQFNPTSRINDSDLVEGGQLLFLQKN